MKEESNILRQSPGIIFKAIGWSLTLLLAIYFIIRNAIPFLSLDPEFYGDHWSHAIFLFVHIAGGILALLVGPLQFWTALRSKNMRLHRLSGRIYLGSVGLSSMAAVYILTLPESSFGFRLGIAGLALSWITTTLFAYLAIRRKKITQHREWMVRSYVVTFGFVFFRLFLDILLTTEIASPGEIVSAVSWLCWAIPLLITELIIQGKKIFA